MELFLTVTGAQGEAFLPQQAFLPHLQHPAQPSALRCGSQSGLVYKIGGCFSLLFHFYVILERGSVGFGHSQGARSFVLLVLGQCPLPALRVLDRESHL